MGINRKIYELYVNKKVTLFIPYKRKTRSIKYVIVDCFGTEMQLFFKLKSIKYPCEIPNMHNITMEALNEFPAKQQLKKLTQK